jgi:hypothetical protein
LPVVCFFGVSRFFLESTSGGCFASTHGHKSSFKSINGTSLKVFSCVQIYIVKHGES